MIIKGRCRGNGAQLANYLLNEKDNIRADFISSYGATSGDPRRALLEMSLTSELSSRTKDGLYHMQLSPRAEEAEGMTWEQKQRAVKITAEAMGMAGHKWTLFEHEKEDGRIHQHLVFERYNHDTGRMWSDTGNYAKHQVAARQMEREFGWQFTHENKEHLDKDIKQHITDMYLGSDDARGFVKAMHTAGFEVTQGIDRRPYQIVDQYGKVRDLTRQMQGVLKQADVSNYLNDIRSELRPTAEASHDRRRQDAHSQQPEPVIDERDLSEAQELAKAMLDYQRQKQQSSRGDQDVTAVERPVESYRYSFKAEQPLVPQLEPAQLTEPQPDYLTEKQDLLTAMIEHVRRRQQVEQETTLHQVQETGRQQTQPTNDNLPKKYNHPLTGQEMTADAYQRLQARIEEKRRFSEELKAKDRLGPAYER